MSDAEDKWDKGANRCKNVPFGKAFKMGISKTGSATHYKVNVGIRPAEDYCLSILNQFLEMIIELAAEEEWWEDEGHAK